MANISLTPDEITYEALRILHAEMSFVGNINRQYDDSFANAGAKIGSTLRIRLPVQYTVLEDTADLSAPGNIQDTIEKNTTLTVDKRATVAMQFSSEELALDIDNFSKRIIRPAMSVMAANIEGRCINDMGIAVNHRVGASGDALAWETVQEARQVMDEELTPMDSQWCVCFDPKGNTQLTSDTKEFFNSQKLIGEQYKKGYITETAGFKFYQNTLISSHLCGARVATGYLATGVVAGDGSSIGVDTGNNSILTGDIFTIAGVNQVHPETKADLGVPYQFVATADLTGAGNLFISPNLISSGAYQNVTADPAIGAQITFLEDADTNYRYSLAFHKDAFTFATADLRMPNNVDFASRQVYDGISMRIIQDYNVITDDFICRADVLYGYRAIRPQLACRLVHS